MECQQTNAQPRPALTTTAACTLLLLISGCGLLSLEPDPGPGSTPAATSSAPAAPTAADHVAAAELTAAHLGSRPASLRVTVSPPTPGVPTFGVRGGLLDAVCGRPEEAARYATISVTFTDRGPGGKQPPASSNLLADVTVEGGSGIGVFERSDAVRSSDPGRYCAGALSGGTSMQTEELSQAHQTMTLYAVVPVGPAAPDSFRGTTLRIANLRVAENSISRTPGPWRIDGVTEGSACSDDPDSLCLPLA